MLFRRLTLHSVWVRRFTPNVVHSSSQGIALSLRYLPPHSLAEQADQLHEQTNVAAAAAQPDDDCSSFLVEGRVIHFKNYRHKERWREITYLAALTKRTMAPGCGIAWAPES